MIETRVQNSEKSNFHNQVKKMA